MLTTIQAMIPEDQKNITTQYTFNINGRDVQRNNVVNNMDKSSLWAP